MMDKLSDKEKYGAAGVLAVAVMLSFGAGAVTTGTTSADAGADTNEVSQEQIRQQVQTISDQQVQTQRQQLDTAANQSENLTRDDLSINSEISEITEEEFGSISLYKANISVTGEIPNQLGSGTQEIDENQVLYMSKDGRYLFQEPTDLQQQQQQQEQQPQQPQQPQPAPQ